MHHVCFHVESRLHACRPLLYAALELQHLLKSTKDGAAGEVARLSAAALQAADNHPELLQLA